MKITSAAFKNNEKIPEKYTCDGENTSPPLEFSEIPENAKSLVLIIDDPMAPMGTWTHWTMWNISPTVSELPEKAAKPEGAIEGMTSFKKTGYGGPCPPKGSEHKYYFHLYALNAMVALKEGSDEADLKNTMKPYVIDEAELIGVYSRK
ncbi:MAG: YbhB/YbcL family Raf kinase inhibitor-like protein [bacterium]